MFWFLFFFSSRRRHTRWNCDWSSDVCSSDLFGQRTTEFEVVDFTPPTTFGWVERGERNGWKTFFRLDRSAESTAVTVRDVWAPGSLIAWLRGKLFEKRRVDSQLEAILSNLRKILAP